MRAVPFQNPRAETPSYNPGTDLNRMKPRFARFPGLKSLVTAHAQLPIGSRKSAPDRI
jgi:hypothetical protein